MKYFPALQILISEFFNTFERKLGNKFDPHCEIFVKYICMSELNNFPLIEPTT